MSEKMQALSIRSLALEPLNESLVQRFPDVLHPAMHHAPARNQVFQDDRADRADRANRADRAEGVQCVKCVESSRASAGEVSASSGTGTSEQTLQQ